MIGWSLAVLFDTMVVVALAVEPDGACVMVTVKTRETVAGSVPERTGALKEAVALLASVIVTPVVGPEV